MKNLSISKKMLGLAIFNAVILLSKPTVSYASDILSEEEIMEFDNIKDYIEAIVNVEIKEKPDKNSKQLGILKQDSKLKLISHVEGYYEVVYKDSIAYVSDRYVKEVVNENYIKNVFLKENSTLYDTECLDKEIDDLNKYEFLQVYEELDNAYYVKVNDTYGYISKNNTEELTDKFVVVDISDQQLDMYDGSDIILSTPVVTGQYKKNDTPTGIYSIYDISDHRDLIGPDYRAYVDYMMKFNGNIGLHDYENHVHPNGKKHGRRDASEFGGDTYLTNGSHGCVNMLNSAAEFVYNNVKKGTKVLVKE